MNILVMASTIKMGGAKTIYNQFISHLPLYIGSDKYLIYVSEWLDRPQIQNVEYVIDKCANGAQRIWHEQKYLEEELRKKGFKPNWVVSLQNNGYKNIKGSRQVVYYHQALPLYDGWYNPFKKSERYLFYYKNIYPFVMQNTWAKDTIFVVQTPIVKERFQKKFGIKDENIRVFFPDYENVEVDRVKACDWSNTYIHFLFVGDDTKYRNGRILIQAISILRNINAKLFNQIKIHITESKDNLPILYSEILKHNLESCFIFEGRVSHEKLLSYYKSASLLLSPSTIETVGLPLLEASFLGIPILSADVDYAHYVLEGYQGVFFVDPYNAQKWADGIELMCSQTKTILKRQNRQSEWEDFFRLLKH